MKKALMLIFFSGGLVASSLAQIPQSKETIFQLLTGGAANPTGKKWKISHSPKKAGVGPITSLEPLYYNYPEGIDGVAVNAGMLNNSYTFRKDSMYIPQNQNVTVHWANANLFFGKNQVQYDDVALIDPKHTTAPFKLRNANTGVGTGYVLDIQNGSYLGYFHNRFEYQIIKITEDSMYVRSKGNDDASADPSNDLLVRYFTFVADKPDPQREVILSHLTGGIIGSQTWLISASPFKTGVGPITSTEPLYYSYPNGLKDIEWTNGALANDYTFSNTGQYTPKNTKATVHYAYANALFGTSQPIYIDVALLDPDHKAAPFILEKSASPLGTGYQLLIRNGSYIGYMQGRNRYQIMKINKDSVYLRNTYSDKVRYETALDSNARYFTLVKGSIVTSLNKMFSTFTQSDFYPNPAKDIVMLQEEVASASVYSSTGEILVKGEGALLNVATLPTGLYLVKVQYKEGSVSWQKLLKE